MSAKRSVHFAPANVSHAPQEYGYTAVNFNSAPIYLNPCAPAASLTSGSPYHMKQSPPFRTGGRGSKQLSKAIEHSAQEKTSLGMPQETEHAFMMHTGNPIYFAKYVSTSSQDPNSLLVQKMQPSHIDQALLVPWEGHLCIVKSENLQYIEMKKEPAGWRILETPMMKRLIADLREQHGCSPSVPSVTTPAPKRRYDEWDYVSLESSDFDECSSRASSSLFQSLAPCLNQRPALTPSNDLSKSVSRPAADCVPIRQSMEISSCDKNSSKQLTSISPADDASRTATSTVSKECKIYSEPRLGVNIPPNTTRVPGILISIPEKPQPLVLESPRPSGGHSLLVSEPGSDSQLGQSRPLGYPPACSSSSLYRTPSPQNIGREMGGGGAVLSEMPDTDLSEVPRLDELIAPTAGLLGLSPVPGITIKDSKSHELATFSATDELSVLSSECKDPWSELIVLPINGQAILEPVGKHGNDLGYHTTQEEDIETEEHKGVTDGNENNSCLQSEMDDIAEASTSKNSKENSRKRLRNSLEAAADSADVVNSDSTERVSGRRPPKPVKKSRNSTDIEIGSPDSAAPLPKRRAAVQGSSYAQRNSFLGSWPSRKQSAAAGTYHI